MSKMSTLKWDVEIISLYFFNPSMRTSSIDIWATIGPEANISWTSSVTVSLFYRRRLIGEATLEDTYIIPEEDTLSIEDMTLEIRDMIGFKSLFRDVMPVAKDWHQKGNGKPAATLEVTDNGHKLLMSIHLDGLRGLEFSEPVVKLTGKEIKITFSTVNPTVVEIDFCQSYFDLMKNGETLAKLTDELNIDCDSNEFVLKGEVYLKSDLSGRAILKGANVDSDANTWFFHAIRQFEIEVDLDEMVHN